MDAELFAIFELPWYVAVTVVEPIGSVEVENVALCDDGTICEVPTTVWPKENVTDPLGIAVGEVTIAVNVTTWPAVEGFFEEIIWTLLVAWTTV